MKQFAIGQRVRLTRDVEKFPNGIAPAGATGTVIQTEGLILVKLDKHLDWLDDWNNELQIMPEYDDDSLEPA